jgi:uncharacterized protein YjaZ
MKGHVKMVFWNKKSGKLIKLERMSDFVSSNLQNSLTSKTFKWYKNNNKSFKFRLELQNVPISLHIYLNSFAFI